MAVEGLDIRKLLIDDKLVGQQDLVAQGSALSAHTPIAKLNHYLATFHFGGGLCEWGTPMGSLSRLLPAVVAQSFALPCLWITDNPHFFYPNAWLGLGFDLHQIHFIKEDKPLESVRTASREKIFKLMVIDIQQFVETSDLHFLARTAAKNGATYFLLRNFFLSNKNGNPYSRYRFNASFSFPKDAFTLSVVKGRRHQSLQLAFSEVLCG